MRTCILCAKSFEEKAKEQHICQECTDSDSIASDKTVLDHLLHRVAMKYNNKIPNPALEDALVKDSCKVMIQLGVSSAVKQGVITNIRKQVTELRVAMRKKLKEIKQKHEEAQNGQAEQNNTEDTQ
jgi:hypothetical protein